jgi:hypothetical protein
MMSLQMGKLGADFRNFQMHNCSIVIRQIQMQTDMNLRGEENGLCKRYSCIFK